LGDSFDRGGVIVTTADAVNVEFGVLLHHAQWHRVGCDRKGDVGIDGNSITFWVFTLHHGSFAEMEAANATLAVDVVRTSFVFRPRGGWSR